jgi:histidyl-tRNA synthetase
MNAFRQAGARADMDHQGRSLKAQFKYADKLGAKHMAIIGDDELAKGVVKLRDMATKEEWEVALADAPAVLKEKLGL